MGVSMDVSIEMSPLHRSRLQVVVWCEYSSTVQQALRVQWGVFGVFVCFGLYFVNYRSWQAEFCKSVLKDVFK